jgi:single-strand DNA-binding protein
MSDINGITITGNLGRDAEQKFTKDSKAVVSFSVANTTGFGDKEQTNWFNCAIFGKKAEGRLHEYLKKGTQVTVQGEVTLNEYTNADGQNKASLKLFVTDIKLQGGRSSGEGQQTPQQPQRKPQNQGQQSPPQQPAGFADFDDDIPW